MQAAIHQALENGVQYYTSMYISLGCSYQSATANTPVPLLEPFGTFKVQGMPSCADVRPRFAMYPDLFSNDPARTGRWRAPMAARRARCSPRTRSGTSRCGDCDGLHRAEPDSRPSRSTRTSSIRRRRGDYLFDGTPYVLIRGASARWASAAVATPTTLVG